MLDTYLDDDKNASLDSLRIIQPDPGARVAANASLEVRTEMLVHGDPRAFFLARQLMRLCYEVHRLAHYDAPTNVFGPLCLGLAKAKTTSCPRLRSPSRPGTPSTRRSSTSSGPSSRPRPSSSRRGNRTCPRPTSCRPR